MKSGREIKERLEILDSLYRRSENRNLILALRQLAWVLEIEWPQRSSAEAEQTVEKS